MTPTPEAVQAATDTYSFVLALVATPAVGNLLAALAALAALISAAAAYLVWRTRRDVKGTEAQLHRRIDRLAATRHPPPPPPESS